MVCRAVMRARGSVWTLWRIRNLVSIWFIVLYKTTILMSMLVGGGCMAPSPFSTEGFEQGKDCTAIPHVASGGVECQSGVCFVHTCEDGFAPNASYDACVAVLHYAAKRVA